MRVLPQQFADRHDHGGSAREGSASGRAHCARATAEDRSVPRGKPRTRAGECRAFPAGSIPSATSCSEWRPRSIPSDSITDAWARYVKNNQSPDGRWQCGSMRPPLESSDFQVTAASIRSVRTYGPKSQRAEYDAAVARAVRLARKGQTDQHGRSCIQDTRVDLGRRKRTRRSGRLLENCWRCSSLMEGGDNCSSLASDAYATGQALVALRESRAVAAHQSGVPARHSVSARALSSKTDRGTSARVRCRFNRISTATSRTGRTSSSPRRRPIGLRWR